MNDGLKTHPNCTAKQNIPEILNFQSIPSDSLTENERELIKCLQYWVLQHPKKPENATVPSTRAELVSFIARLFVAFQKEEKETWSQLTTLHLLTPSMLQLYQKKFTQVQAMNWIQLLCYKVVACPNGKGCRSFREQKMLHNQFYDFELECPFFHDKKDKRRIVLPEMPQEEFMYKGKYQEGVSEEYLDASFSHNYFESVYHPLFYKFFDCKRVQCRSSIFCPMKHSDEERIVWEEEFSLNWRKDRSIYYPKKKKNYSEFSENSAEDKPYARKQQHHKKKHYQRNTNDQSYTQKQISNNFDLKGKENAIEKDYSTKNSHEHLSFFEGELAEGESKFLKFFSAGTSFDTHKIGANDCEGEENSGKSCYKYFPEKENQPLFNIHNVFSNAFNSNDEYKESNQKKIGFHNGKKAHQSMRTQNQHITVL